MLKPPGLAECLQDFYCNSVGDEDGNILCWELRIYLSFSIFRSVADWSKIPPDKDISRTFVTDLGWGPAYSKSWDIVCTEYWYCNMDYSSDIAQSIIAFLTTDAHTGGQYYARRCKAATQSNAQCASTMQQCSYDALITYNLQKPQTNAKRPLRYICCWSKPTNQCTLQCQ